jgi:hypothetical protein
MFPTLLQAPPDAEPAYAAHGESDAYPNQSAFLHDALRVAAGLPRELPPVDLFKRESPCPPSSSSSLRLCA